MRFILRARLRAVLLALLGISTAVAAPVPRYNGALSDISESSVTETTIEGNTKTSSPHLDASSVNMTGSASSKDQMVATTWKWNSGWSTESTSTETTTTTSETYNDPFPLWSSRKRRSSQRPMPSPPDGEPAADSQFSAVGSSERNFWS